MDIEGKCQVMQILSFVQVNNGSGKIIYCILQKRITYPQV